MTRADTLGRSAEGEDKNKQFEISWRKIHVTCDSFPELCNPARLETTLWEFGVGMWPAMTFRAKGAAGSNVGIT